MGGLLFIQYVVLRYMCLCVETQLMRENTAYTVDIEMYSMHAYMCVLKHGRCHCPETNNNQNKICANEVIILVNTRLSQKIENAQ